MALERDVDGVKEYLQGVRMQEHLKATGETYHTVHLPASEEDELSAPVAAVHPWDGASAPPLFVCVDNTKKEVPGMVLPGDYVPEGYYKTSVEAQKEVAADSGAKSSKRFSRI